MQKQKQKLLTYLALVVVGVALVIAVVLSISGDYFSGLTRTSTYSTDLVTCVSTGEDLKVCANSLGYTNSEIEFLLAEYDNCMKKYGADSRYPETDPKVLECLDNVVLNMTTKEEDTTTTKSTLDTSDTTDSSTDCTLDKVGTFMDKLLCAVVGEEATEWVDCNESYWDTYASYYNTYGAYPEANGYFCKHDTANNTYYWTNDTTTEPSTACTDSNLGTFDSNYQALCLPVAPYTTEWVICDDEYNTIWESYYDEHGFYPQGYDYTCVHNDVEGTYRWTILSEPVEEETTSSTTEEASGPTESCTESNLGTLDSDYAALCLPVAPYTTEWVICDSDYKTVWQDYYDEHGIYPQGYDYTCKYDSTTDNYWWAYTATTDQTL
ncbi:hypothetical protein GF354_04280 [Candidatus Peregrinibacteria bacterium]|nr:hypothetical protein [Candidatus Peregrinibacteria bacterium]